MPEQGEMLILAVCRHDNSAALLTREMLEEI
jgi:hypothetical protein